MKRIMVLILIIATMVLLISCSSINKNNLTTSTVKNQTEMLLNQITELVRDSDWAIPSAAATEIVAINGDWMFVKTEATPDIGPAFALIHTTNGKMELVSIGTGFEPDDMKQFSAPVDLLYALDTWCEQPGNIN
jgi:hypothetical protein